MCNRKIVVMNTDEIFSRAQKIIRGKGTRNEKLQAICELLDREIEVFDWTGFYLVAPDEERMLELGPYVGEATDHTRIAFGTGICGQAAETLNTFVVQDVKQADNYLACSVDVQSEIVVPVMKGNQFVGELDIDSHTKNAITPELTNLCEKICKEISFIFPD